MSNVHMAAIIPQALPATFRTTLLIRKAVTIMVTAFKITNTEDWTPPILKKIERTKA